MTKLEHLKLLHSYLKAPNIDSLNLSLADTHQEGLFSLVIHGTEYGKLTRVFIAEKEIKPYAAQLHTHRYPLRLTTIQGNIKHHNAFLSEITDCYTVNMSKFLYKSPLNGGNGLSYLQEEKVMLRDYDLPIGASLEMSEKDFHTVSCSAGSIWVVEERGFQRDHSYVLGVPFTIDGLYNKPTMFQVNDKCQLVSKAIKKLILDYETIN